MAKAQILWIILPYIFVFLGLVVYKSAWGALIGFHVGLLPVLILNWQKAWSGYFAPVSKRLLLAVGLSGLFGGLGIWLVWPYTGVQPVFSKAVAGLGLSGAAWLPFIIYFSLVNPWLEEGYWRGIFTSQSAQLALVDILFAAYHLIILSLFVSVAWMLFAFCILVFASWFWRQVSRYTGSLLPAVFAHALADLSIVLVLYYFSI